METSMNSYDQQNSRLKDAFANVFGLPNARDAVEGLGPHSPTHFGIRLASGDPRLMKKLGHVRLTFLGESDDLRNGQNFKPQGKITLGIFSTSKTFYGEIRKFLPKDGQVGLFASLEIPSVSSGVALRSGNHEIYLAFDAQRPYAHRWLQQCQETGKMDITLCELVDGKAKTSRFMASAPQAHTLPFLCSLPELPEVDGRALDTWKNMLVTENSLGGEGKVFFGVLEPNDLKMLPQHFLN